MKYDNFIFVLREIVYLSGNITQGRSLFIFRVTIQFTFQYSLHFLLKSLQSCYDTLPDVSLSLFISRIGRMSVSLYEV